MTEKTHLTDWVKIIERWKKSGLSQNRFCIKTGISLSAMRYHLRQQKRKTGFINVKRLFFLRKNRHLVLRIYFSRLFILSSFLHELKIFQTV